jgi:hypothetical protein
MANYLRMGAGLLLVILIIGVVWHLREDHKVRNQLATLQGQADKVVIALGEATGEESEWKTAPGQIRALGDSRKALQVQVETQNAAIDDMAREAVKLKAEAKELRLLYDKAKAQRRSAYVRLSEEAITPGAREDCNLLIAQANEALTLLREASQHVGAR